METERLLERLAFFMLGLAAMYAWQQYMMQATGPRLKLVSTANGPSESKPVETNFDRTMKEMGL